MPITRVSSVVVFMFIVVSTLQAAALDSGSVRVCSKIPLVSGFGDLPIEAAKAEFDLYSDRSVSTVTITNDTPKSIVEILVLVDYLDATNRHILTAIYYARQHDVGPLPLRSQMGAAILKLEKAIGPNDYRRIAFTSDLVAPQCPAHGVITRISLAFDDGTNWSNSSPAWRTDPVIREAQKVDVTAFPNRLPAVFSVRAQIGANGARVVDEGNGEAQAGAWLQDQFRSWSFLPAEHGPFATDYDQLTLLVVVHKRLPVSEHPTNNSSPRLRKPESPYIVVEIWPADQQGYALVFVGGAVASQHALPDRP